jgi:hypothetical protein
MVLLDKIQKIKITANKVFFELNQTGNLDKLPQLLRDYDWKFWEKILNFVKLYYKIELPDLGDMESEVKKKMREVDGSSKVLKDFSAEYELIVSLNKNIAKEFVQLLHEYRSQKVNSANLDLEQLYNPQKLYDYLRNHHWKNEIPEEFLNKWVHMENSQYELNEIDKTDFETIFKRLNVEESMNLKLYGNKSKNNKIVIQIKDENVATKTLDIPSISNFPEFKKWILKRLDEIEDLMV